jgi:hypothetical protein
MIVVLEPLEARAGTVARAQCREQFGPDDIEAGIVVFGDDGEYWHARPVVDMADRRASGIG